MQYQQRTYRDHLATSGLVSFTVSVRETDLFISAARNLAKEAQAAVVQARSLVEEYGRQHPDFLSSFAPLPLDESAPRLIQNMLTAAAAAGVGPMAAVAGAIAEYTGLELLNYTDEVVVENGGDIFVKVSREITIGVFAGESPLSNRIGIKLPASENPLGICTSSGTVGPSFSFGTADSVTVIAKAAALADAAATAVANLIKEPSDIQKGIDFAENIKEITGILIIKDKQMGAWGDLQLVSL